MIVFMVFSSIGITGYSYAETNDSAFDYELTSEGAIITGLRDTSVTEINIPDNIEGYEVTGIGDEAFYANDKITSLTMPDSVTTIGDFAFAGCFALSEIELSQNLKTVGQFGFASCSIESLVFPNSVEYMGYAVLGTCDKITSLTLSDNITELPAYMLSDSVSLKTLTIPSKVIKLSEMSLGYGLETVYIPKNVTVIENYCFSPSLKNIYYEGSQEDWGYIQIAKYNELDGATIHYNCLEIQDDANSDIYECDHIWDADYTIDKNATCAEEGAKSIRCGICGAAKETAVIEKADHIWNDGEVTTEPTFEKEGTKTFTCNDCSATKEEIIPPLYKDVIDYSVSEDGVTIKGIKDKNITELVIPEVIDDKPVIKIGSSAFSSCFDLRSVVLPASVKEIESRAFQYCGIESVTLNDGLERIGSYAFSNTTNLKSIVIPGSVTYISGTAFQQTYLEEIQLPFIGNSPDAVNNNEKVFGSIFGCTIEYGGSLKDYKTIEGATYQTYVYNPNYTYYNKRYAAYYYYIPETIKKVIITDTKSIPHNAFYGCENIEEIILSDTVESVEYNTFYNCSGLIGALTLPASVNSIGSNAFDGCEKLEKVIILNDSCEIAQGAATFEETIKLSGNSNSEARLYAIKHNRYFSCLTHDWQQDYTVDKKATCTEEGVSSIHCKNCNDVKDITAIDKEEHSYGDWIIDKEATCLTSGVKYKKCSCGHKAIETIDAAGHVWDDDYTIDRKATCIAEGSKSIHCQNCSEIKDVVTIDTGEHTYTSWTIALKATCTGDGEKYSKCNDCPSTVKEVISATGHNWSSDYTVDVKATCTAEGSKSIHCKNCSETKEVTIIEKIPHSYSISSVTLPTCDKEGYTTYKCTCGDIYKGDKIAAKGHFYGTWTTTEKATCVTNGMKQSKCTRCQEIIEQEIPATGHNVVNDVEVTPTCAENGLTPGSHCSTCKSVILKQEIIPAKGHVWDSDFTIDIAPTFEKKGSKSIHCQKCEERKEITVIDKITNTFDGPEDVLCSSEGDVDDEYTYEFEVSHRTKLKMHIFADSKWSDEEAMSLS